MNTKTLLLLTLSTLQLALWTGCGHSKSASAEPDLETIKRASVESRKQPLLDWNLHSLVGAYEKQGHHDPKWDHFAQRALTNFARIRVPGAATAEDYSSTAVKDAIAAGCDDPMIGYLHVRMLYGSPQTKNPEAVPEWVKAGDALLASSYGPVPKFYGALRAVQACHSITVKDAVPPETRRFWKAALQQADAVLRDNTTPMEEAYDVAHELIEIMRRTPDQREKFYQTYEPVISENWPASMQVWLLKGEFHVSFAWDARGSGYANTVTDEGWKGFRERLDLAEAALEKAWKIQPDERIALAMLRVELGQGKGKDRMELWFQRAMGLNPCFYEACWHKLEYLHPKWHGSEAAYLAFGRQCASSTNWGGRVPLILADAHDGLTKWKEKDPQKRLSYWKQAGVWEDVRSSYERFFAVNPDAIGWRHNYALCAYRCEQWDEFRKQIQLFPATNHAYFGGQVEFDKMVKLAEERKGAVSAR